MKLCDHDPRLHHIVAAQPYPLLSATISGAHVLLTRDPLLLPSPRANKETLGSLRREL
jgi:hypothetical protein